MSTWYDPTKGPSGGYRESIPYKVFYKWTWPLSRWLMFRYMTSEQAHWFAIHIAIPTVYIIDCIWAWCVTLTIIALQIALVGFALFGAYCYFWRGLP